MALLDGHLCLQLSDADCTGIAIGHDSVAWCLQEDGARSVRELRDGQVRTVALSDEPLDLHDILFDGDDAFVAATQTNEVLRLDARRLVQDRWVLGEEPDSVHVNCLAMRDGRLLASIFGRFDAHRAYKGSSRGAGQVIDVRSGDTLIEGLSQPHSLVVDGNHLYVCSSEDKEVIVYSGARKTRTIDLPGYTRGLAIGEAHVYVGLSCSRNMEIESQTGHFESGAVAILRKKDMRLLGTVPVPWREIYDIRIIRDRVLLQSLMAASWERERSVVQAAAQSSAASRTELERRIGERDEQLRAAGEANKSRDSRIAELQEKARQRDELVAALQGKNAERDARIAELERKVVERDARIAESQGRARERDELVAALQGKNAERDGLIATLQAKNAERDARIAELQQKTRERDQRLQAMASATKARDLRIDELRDVARERNERIGDLERRSAKRDKRMREMGEALKLASRKALAASGLIESRDGRISELEASLALALERESQLRNQASDLAIRVKVLREIESEHAMLLQSRSWRLTRPLRFAMRVLRNRGLDAGDRERVRALMGRGGGRLRTGGTAAQLPPPSAPIGAAAQMDPNAWYRKLAPWKLRKTPDQVVPSPQRPGVDDIFVWGVIDWHFRIQRPQHLARELAASGRRVFYVSNNFIDSDQPGFKVEPLDQEGNLFQVFLNVPGKQVIYFDPPDETVQAQLDASLRELLAWTRSTSTVALVQHPYWSRLARALPNHRLVYDCMDHHGGFDNNGSRILAVEEQLMREADLLVVSSIWLDDEGVRFNANRALIRNAGQYEHFSKRPDKVFSDAGRRVIGYYGAIAPWFDVDLVDRVAEENPDCLVLLVGADTCNARERLAHRANIRFVGEVPYAELPFYLHGFDVCILPFQVLPLTLATNPVKAYEYLSAGKPVVTVDLPEMRQFGDLVRTSSTAAGFIADIRSALDERHDHPSRHARREFAAGQTWRHRADALLDAIAAIPEPRVSIVVLTYNNLDLTKACLDSIQAHTDYPNSEVIVVDNASSDGSQEYLREWVSGGEGRKLVANDVNRGFAAGNNQGLEAAEGEYLVLLNNDTRVTPGWLRTMLAHLRNDPSIGIVGPVTNNIGNEARIETDYHDDAGMLAAASEYTLRHAGKTMDLATVAFFCVMIPRRVYEQIGGLDEAFGVGFFEDDDYCRRVEGLGLRVACAEDVFVHHHLSASFNKLASMERKELFERNKAIYESKWGEWRPHRYREKEQA